MKKIAFIIVILTAFVVSAMSQTQFVDIRLSAVYSQEDLDNLEENNPQKLDFMNWSLDNSYTIVDAGYEKCLQMPYLKHFDPVNKIIGANVENLSEEDLNIYMFLFERQYDKKAHYRIGDTGKAIVFKSHTELSKNFKIYQDEL